MDDILLNQLVDAATTEQDSGFSIPERLIRNGLDVYTRYPHIRLVKSWRLTMDGLNMMNRYAPSRCTPDMFANYLLSVAEEAPIVLKLSDSCFWDPASCSVLDSSPSGSTLEVSLVDRGM